MKSWKPRWTMRTPCAAEMKIECPKCRTTIQISDDAVLKQIERSDKLRAKTASLLGRLTGGKTKLDAEGRRLRAKRAVQAREAGRRAKNWPPA